MNDVEEGPVAIDLFCGAGGLSLGLKQAGFKVVSAIECDEEIAKTYATNHPETKLLVKDIRQTMGKELLGDRTTVDLIAGCPPCQGFSKLTAKYKKEDPRNDLALEMVRIVEEIRPRMVMVENVPGLAGKGKPILDQFIARLEAIGYVVSKDVLQMANYGVPQTRRRFVLLAGMGFAIPLPEPTHSRLGDKKKGLKPWVTLKEALGRKAKKTPIGFARAGRLGGARKFNWHVVSDLSELSRKRLAALKQGMSRRDLPVDLRPVCHKESDDGFENVYGRMRWDLPSPTITGGCTTPCAGRFGHPSQARAISIREAATIQSFPESYEFDTDFISKAATMVGNALPVRFAKIAGRACLKSYLAIKGNGE